jgi:hypothetical protein
VAVPKEKLYQITRPLRTPRPGQLNRFAARADND